MQFARFYTKESQDFCADGYFRVVAHHESPQTYVVPQSWNQTAVSLLQEDVFYPEVLPAALKRVPEPDVPAWLQRSMPDNAARDSVSAEWRHHVENDIRDVLHRIAGSLAYQGWKDGTFASEDDAKVFYDELRYILLHRIASPELKQWQLLGLDWAYGFPALHAYAPQRRTVSYTQDTAQVLRRLTILGETLALDTATSSGTQDKINAILPVENADSPDFINWKKNRDTRQAAETLGRRVMEAAARRVMDACDRDDPNGFSPHGNAALQTAMDTARKAGLPEAAVQMAISYAQQGYEDISFALPAPEKTAEDCVETTLSVPDAFIEAALTGHSFDHQQAQKLWDTLTEAIWSSGAPAIAFRDSIAMNIAPEASADTATDASSAPAATINLLACGGGDTDILDTAALRHVSRVMVTALEILPCAAPKFRPLQLGMTNMAALLMSKGLAYDSPQAHATAALTAAFVSGAARHASAEIAAEKGAYPAYARHAKGILQKIKDKIALLSGTPVSQTNAMRRPLHLRPALCPDAALHGAVRQIWDDAYHLGRETGFRHARLTDIINSDWPVQALLGAESQGLMPVATQLHGKSLTPLVPAALKALGYNAAESNDIYFHAAGHGTLLDAPFINHKSLRRQGFHQAALDAVEAALATALHIRYVFNRWTLGDDFCEHMLGFSADEIADETFDMLPALGFDEEQIEAANAYCCGTLGLAGAPHLKPAHMAVFDCSVSPAAQIKMQAAVEPFLSGVTAHTIRLDYAATIDDVRGLILAGWEYGIKNMRLYRDNGSLLHDIAIPAAHAASGTKIAGNQSIEPLTGRKSA